MLYRANLWKDTQSRAEGVGGKDEHDILNFLVALIQTFPCEIRNVSVLKIQDINSFNASVSLI